METINPSDIYFTAAVGLICFVIGVIVAWAVTQSRLRGQSEQTRLELVEYKSKVAADQDKLAWLDSAQAKMNETFRALASETLYSNSDEFLKRTDEKLLNVVTPLKENLASLDKQVRELEVTREGAYKGLGEQLKQLSSAHNELKETNISLKQALRSPTVRGRWGELLLGRVVEMAGLVKNIHYEEQVDIGSGRPDMIARLPNGGMLPIDAKVPLEAYLDAMEANDDGEKRAKLLKHAKAMKDRVRDLSSKQYWAQFEEMPDFVVMFVPIEACLGAAFDADPKLLEFAIEQRVMITTPVTLVSMLKTVAYGWQQQQITENSREITEQGKELYKRLSTLVNYLSELQGNLNKTVGSFNKTVGSLESRLIPAAKRFEDMGISTEKIIGPAQIDGQARTPPQLE